jgi:SAM-dependent methyltransferase
MLTASVSGTAASIIEQLDGHTEFHDIYDPLGAGLYEAVALQDAHELREIISIARKSSGPVLELACGTGRFTFPLLAMGKEVTAVDISESMLEHLTRRLESEYPHLAERLTLIHGDISTIRCPGLFNTAILGCVSISLLDEAQRNRFFRNIRSVLTASGRLYLSTTVTDGDPELARAGTPIDSEQAVFDRQGRHYTLYEHIVGDRSVREITVIPDERPAGTAVPVFRTTVRILPPAQLTAEMEEAGLRTFAQHPVSTPGTAHDIVILEAGADA